MKTDLSLVTGILNILTEAKYSQGDGKSAISISTELRENRKLILDYCEHLYALGMISKIGDKYIMSERGDMFMNDLDSMEWLPTIKQHESVNENSKQEIESNYPDAGKVERYDEYTITNPSIRGGEYILKCKRCGKIFKNVSWGKALNVFWEHHSKKHSSNE